MMKLADLGRLARRQMLDGLEGFVRGAEKLLVNSQLSTKPSLGGTKPETDYRLDHPRRRISRRLLAPFWALQHPPEAERRHSLAKKSHIQPASRDRIEPSTLAVQVAVPQVGDSDPRASIMYPASEARFGNLGVTNIASGKGIVTSRSKT